MITAARPTIDGAAHWYYPNGMPCYTVKKTSSEGDRPTNVSDARKFGLLPSPTQILKMLAKPMLEAWKIEMACLAVLTTPRSDTEELDAFVKRVIQTDRVQDEERNAAAEKGKAIHRAIQEALDTGLMEPIEFVRPVIAQLAYLGRVVATEKVVVGSGYAGMTDCILENDTEIWDVDFKTSRNIPDKPYDEAKLQIAAYCAALGNTGDKRIHSAIIYISTTNPGEIKVCETNWNEDFARFKLLLEFWKLTNKLI